MSRASDVSAPNEVKTQTAMNSERHKRRRPRFANSRICVLETAYHRAAKFRALSIKPDESFFRALQP